MNNNQNPLNRIHEVINKGATGTILLPAAPSFDATAAATALYLGLTKLGKTVGLACTTSVHHDLTGVDKIQSNLVTGGDSLVVSFPYADGAIDKVDYNIQGSSFNLIVTPRPGHSKLQPSQVNYSYTGGTVDFFIVIDAPTLNSLGALYSDNQNQFVGHEIINIDRHLTNGFFGTVNFVNKTSSSICELVLTVLQNLKVEIDREIATNLYAGISASTNNFTSYSVNADTFEHVATLLRLGAVKKPTFSPKVKVSSSLPNKEAYRVKPMEEVEKEVPTEQKTPQDWLKPKIFRGGGGLV
jgi:nanoRNase/pAp phosphatase (c-di-AMP/oligoRNAs hydrolase)